MNAVVSMSNMLDMEDTHDRPRERKLYQKHSPSLSSPSSHQPFSTKSEKHPPRKVSLHYHPGDVISYPMIVTRDDVSPFNTTLIPPPPPTEPTSTSTANSLKNSKSRPAPLKLPNSSHANFLGPLLENPFSMRFSKSDKDKEKGRESEKEKGMTMSKEVAGMGGELNKERFIEQEPRVFLSNRKGRESDDDWDQSRIGNVDDIAATASSSISKIPGLSTRKSKSNLKEADSAYPTASQRSERNAIALARDEPLPTIPQRVRQESTTTTGGVNVSKTDRVSASLSNKLPVQGPLPASYVLSTRVNGHRRTASASPKLLSAAQIESNPERRMSAKDRSNTTTANSRPSGVEKSRVRVAQSLLQSPGSPVTPVTPDKTGVAAATTTPVGSAVRGRFASHAGIVSSYDDAFFSPSQNTPVGSATRRPSFVPKPLNTSDSVGISVRDAAGHREIARAAYSSVGIAVSLRSAEKPEDVEVGWVCSPGIDDSGNPYTEWEIRLTPKATKAAQLLPFSNYSIAASPGRSAPPHPPSPRSRSAQLTLPADYQDVFGHPFANSSKKGGGDLGNKGPNLSGGSFSSESSGPLTPRRGVLRFGRAGSEGEVNPLIVATPSPHREERANSYTSVAEQFRQGQHGLTEKETLALQLAANSPPGIEEKTGPKSPKSHRFGRYLPTPITVDFNSLTGLVQNVTTASGSTGSGSDSPSESPFIPLPPRVDSLQQQQQQQQLSPTKKRDTPISPSRSLGTRESLKRRSGNRTAVPIAQVSYPPSNSRSETSDDTSNSESDLNTTELQLQQHVPSAKEIAKGQARMRNRAVSKWSDTEGETEEDEENGAGITSWSKVPDARDSV